MAPVLSFTAEETWQRMNHLGEGEALLSSIHLQELPESVPLPDEPQLLGRWEKLAQVREEVLKRLEVARNEKRIGNSLEAWVVLDARGDLLELLRAYRPDLPALFIVSEVELGAASPEGHAAEALTDLRIEIRKAPGDKCERCWNFRRDRGIHPEYPTLCGRCASALEEIRGGPLP